MSPDTTAILLRLLLNPHGLGLAIDNQIVVVYAFQFNSNQC